MLEKTYNPKPIEEKIYKIWEKSGFFNPDNLPGKRDKKYIIYMPLPNITGTLHMGHALNNTLQDILIRYYRMKNYKTLYLPGTDHAGIATQYVVEKELKKQGVSRFELGREKFIEKIWEWKNKYGDLILEQLKNLGVSADWSRKRFTMDEEYSKDVINAFIHYYKRGLIYRGLRTINWCIRCGTSLSELELEYEDEKTTLYYVKYGPFMLATTRPETKFGDTALAVNPKDERYKKYIGKELEIDSLDITGNLENPKLKKIKIKVVADIAADLNFGTGVIKVTPAHDITDFEIGQRHNLPSIQVIDNKGGMNENAGKYVGMKIKEARLKIVEDLKTTGLLIKEELYDHRVAKCYRCNSIIEPLPSKQWFLKMDNLADTALNAVTEKKVRITPKNFEKTYTNWLKNIKDWTISRQIWWGHQLPVFFCLKNEEEFVISLKKPENCPFCEKCKMKQSEDILDTWFSSALWPFGGFSSSDLKKYYPGNTLITARDILNLWVARMIFSGLEFQKKVPFKNVLIHGTILTKEGKRMSKSLGTGINPLKYINEHGADATRFGIIWQSFSQDIKWDEANIIAGRKFANKIWNASRFIIMNLPAKNSEPKITPKDNKKLTLADKKIIKDLSSIKKNLEKNIEKFEFSKGLQEIYHFFWHNYCDIYLEKSKKQLNDPKTKKGTQKLLLFTLLESLKMLHLFMPFITEEIYEKIPVSKKSLLMIAKWK